AAFRDCLALGDEIRRQATDAARPDLPVRAGRPHLRALPESPDRVEDADDRGVEILRRQEAAGAVRHLGAGLLQPNPVRHAPLTRGLVAGQRLEKLPDPLRLLLVAEGAHVT